jgi:hypothetical protein
MKPYWTVDNLAFATQNAASRCFRGTVESAVESIFREEEERWKKVYLALTDDDARREALVKRFTARGYRADEIHDIVTVFLFR